MKLEMMLNAKAGVATSTIWDIKVKKPVYAGFFVWENADMASRTASSSGNEAIMADGCSS